MSRWNKPKDSDTRLRKLESASRKSSIASYNPGELPDAPSPPTIDFEIKEYKTHPEYKAIVTWVAGSANTCQADVDYYVVELRATDIDGNVKVHNRTRRANIKGTADPLNAVFSNVSNPRTWYRQARVRLTDKAHRESPFSDWSTPPVLPSVDADPKPPTIDDIAVDFDQKEKQRHSNRIRAIVSWNDVSDWDIPGYDKEGDVARYNVVMRRCTFMGAPIIDDFGLEITRTKKVPSKGGGTVHATFQNLGYNYYYQFSVQAVDRFNRKGDWSEWTTASTPSDNTNPPPPTNVVSWESIAHVGVAWDAPLDNSGEIWDADVEYFQVQIATSKTFSSGSIVKRARYVNNEDWGFHTQKYRIRYWLRVRSVDASGNTSSWVEATDNPVSPLQANAKRGSEPDVNWGEGHELNLAGRATNRAYVESGSDDLVAWIVTDDIDGDLYCNVTGSVTTERVLVGVAFRIVDANNYLAAYILRTSGNNKVLLTKTVAGSETTLETWIPAAYNEGDTWEIHVNLNGNDIEVFVEGTSRLTHTLTGGDITLFGVGSSTAKVGLYIQQGASLDDLKSRWDDFKWQAVGETTNEIYDDFDRDADTADLGVANSGQTWVQGSGVWGISPDGASGDAIYGISSIMPIFFGEDPSQNTSESIPNNGDPKLYGQEGNNTPAIELYINRPVKISAWATGELENEDADSVQGWFYIVFSDDGGSTLMYGRRARQGCPQNERRLFSNIRQLYYDPESTPVILTAYWGYKTGVGGAGHTTMTVAEQKMMIIVSYAPDVPVGAASTKSVGWTRRQIMKRSYRNVEGNDPSGL